MVLCQLCYTDEAQHIFDGITSVTEIRKDTTHKFLLSSCLFSSVRWCNFQKGFVDNCPLWPRLSLVGHICLLKLSVPGALEISTHWRFSFLRKPTPSTLPSCCSTICKLGRANWRLVQHCPGVPCSMFLTALCVFLIEFSPPHTIGPFLCSIYVLTMLAHRNPLSAFKTTLRSKINS